MEELQRAVLARYDEIARSCEREPGEESGLGCARLAELVQLFPGEVLLDIGSGPGLETIELARLVNPAPAFGLDALPSMVEVAEENARKAGASNARFLVGRMEAIPLEDGCVDVVVSNCVINLSPDKERVMREIWRVLRPGGRVAVADMVWLGPPPALLRTDPEAWACCIGGALEATEYPLLFERVGFTDVRLQILGTFDPAGLSSCCPQGTARGADGLEPSTGPEAPPATPSCCCASRQPAALASALVTARKPGPPGGTVEVREARSEDLGLVLRILQAAGLPTAGVSEHLGSFLLACTPEGRVVGVAGLERYSASALLRSLVVLPSWRRQGLGRRLVTAQLSRLAPGTPVYLLTTSAQRYFASLGFQAIPRGEVPPEVKESLEFREACPQSATAMYLRVY
ncbi:MAG: arsenic resistance N-acetyltransferase ArsN2 [Bacillota bacterium]